MEIKIEKNIPIPSARYNGKGYSDTSMIDIHKCVAAEIRANIEAGRIAYQREQIARAACAELDLDMDDLLWALDGTVLWRRIAKREPSFWDLDEDEQLRSIDNHQMSEDEVRDDPRNGQARELNRSGRS